MQWTPGPQAGFSTNPSTWLPIPPNHVQLNIATETADPNSLLNWYTRLLALRRTVPALATGTMTLAGSDPDILAWLRTDPASGNRVLVAINMSEKNRRTSLSALDPTLQAGGGQAYAAAGGAGLSGADLTLPPFAVWIGPVGTR
jgi:alpha-glucosidase